MIITITSAPLYFVFRDFTEKEGEVRWTFIVGATMSLIGILGQTLADHQLRQYKAKRESLKKSDSDPLGNVYQSLDDPASLGEDPRFPGTFKGGLWRKSRHPNLFFDLTTWIGFFIAGLNDFSFSWIGIIGPIMLFISMQFLTTPLTEKTMAYTRPYWEQHVKESTKFLII